VTLPAVGFGPDPDEAAEVARTFGVGTAQVDRDHLISHVLAALGDARVGDRLVFLGGTALSRTLLPDLRLSEDIDLLARGRRDEVARAVTVAVTRALARTHGRVTWTPPLDRPAGVGVSVLGVEGTGIRVQVQLLAETGYPAWPTVVLPIHQRYRDAPPATLRTLTPEAFVAAKLAAWHDRHAPRDLYDLWGLATAGWLTRGGLDLFRTLGPTNRLPDATLFRTLPDPDAWSRSLAHQCRLEVGPAEAAGAVLDALEHARQ
jgi:hypothetical protein